MSKRLSEHKIDQMRILYKEGHSYVSIGKIIGCSSVTVKNWINKSGIETVKYNKKLPQINTNEIIKKYQDGQSSKKIAKEAQCSQHEILRILKENDSITVKKYIDKKVYAQIIDKYANGASPNDLANEHKVTPRVIRKFLVRNNITIRNNYLTYEQKMKIIDLHQKGLNGVRIAQITHCSKACVSRILKNYDIVVNRRPLRHKDDVIINAYKCNNNISDASRNIGCSDTHMRRVLIANGITIKPYIGENCYNWQGGISDKNDIIRHSLLYKQWHNYNLDRSDNKDEVTELKEQLNVHHIYPLRIILKSSLTKHICLPNEYKNIAIMNDQRFYDLNNGLVLNVENHKLIEQNPRDCHPWWRIWKCFPDFAIKKSKISEEQFLIFNENGQIDPQNNTIIKSDKNDVKQIIRYEHYLGTVPASQLILTAQKNGIIVGVATFGRPNRHMRKDTWELTRLCVPHYVVRPFTIKFLDMCIQYIRETHKDIENILSYSDTSVGHDGAVYRMSGFKNCGYTKSSYAYFDLDNYILRHKSFCRRIKGVNKTEKEIAIERNLIKIPLTPKKRWNYGV